jgi:beta-lactamase regulating signal transducer with metallopeptidase domain
MEAAIAHEMAHIRALDNLKQLLLNATRFPRFLSTMTEIEHSLGCATEISADARALDAKISPLDLGSAILKVARLRAYPTMSAVAASHLVPDFNSSTLRARVERLESLVQQEHGGRARTRNWSWMAGATVVLLIYFIKVDALLVLTHKLTEILVR